MRRVLQILTVFAALTAAAFAAQPPEARKQEHNPMTQQQNPPTVADAEAFMASTEATLNDLTVKLARAQWVQATYITDDTELISADYNERMIAEPSAEASAFLALQPERARGVRPAGQLARG